MASTIRIKRSGVSGNPSTLAAGELAYSAADASSVQGGDRLYIGFGSETNGNAAEHIVIGGEFFTSMLDHSKGTLTADSALVVDSNKKINELNVDNLSLDGNTISSTDSDGDIVLEPDGTGRTVANNLFIDDGSTQRDIQEYIEDITGGQIQGTGGVISVTYDDDAGTSTLDLVETGVTVGSYGSSTKIPTFTVDADGRLTAAGEQDVATTLSLSGDNSTSGSVDLLNDTLNFTGVNAITTDVSANSDGSIDTVTITADSATTTSRGVASFDSGDFVVSSGAVSIGPGAVDNNQIANPEVTVGTTTVSLGGTQTALSGLTQVDVDNLTLDGNAIKSTDTDGDVVLDPDGSGNVSVSDSRITDLEDPVDPQDAATKAYVDARAAGLDPKESVRVATTGSVDLTTDLTNGNTIDGVTLATGDRILVKNQTDATENGIYIVVSSGTATRSTDFDEPEEVTSGVFFFIEEGTANGDAGFVLTSTGGQQTIGTDNLTFVQFSGAGQIIAGDGISKSGNTLFVNTDNGIEISGDQVQLASSVAGDGLTYDTGVLNVVGTSNRISVDGNSVDIASTYVGQTSITTLGTITTGTWQGDTIGAIYGGTGLSSYSKGDLVYASGTDTLARRAAGATGAVLQMSSSGEPVWGDIDGGTY